MSVGPPLYTGHLMMLAGFTAAGNPIVHDPARSNGYAYVYNKNDLAYSWFEKGGIGYTFFPADSQISRIDPEEIAARLPGGFRLYQNYPNPFNPVTHIPFEIAHAGALDVSVYNERGQKIRTLFSGYKPAGTHLITWDASGLPSGTYFIRITGSTRSFGKSIKAVLVR
jgi:hypothetical protein